jgi:hypothetical protein
MDDRMRLDLHVHSDYSFDSKIDIKTILNKLPTLGLDGIVFTDHDSVNAYPKAKELAEKLDVKVFSGVEITTKEGHILAYGITDDPPYHRSVDETIEWIHDNNGAAVCAHPFRTTAPSLAEKVYQNRFDALEINGRCTFSQNRAAGYAANMLNVSLVGGSDAHYLSKVGRIATIFHEEIETDGDLVEAIIKGNCEVYYQTPEVITEKLMEAVPLKDITIITNSRQKKEEIFPVLAARGTKEAKFFDSSTTNE